MSSPEMKKRLQGLDSYLSQEQFDTFFELSNPQFIENEINSNFKINNDCNDSKNRKYGSIIDKAKSVMLRDGINYSRFKKT